jgi:hypothetical protein
VDSKAVVADETVGVVMVGCHAFEMDNEPEHSLSCSLWNTLVIPTVIPLLEDTLKERGFLQVMTQVIG